MHGYHRCRHVAGDLLLGLMPPAARSKFATPPAWTSRLPPSRKARSVTPAIHSTLPPGSVSTLLWRVKLDLRAVRRVTRSIPRDRFAAPPSASTTSVHLDSTMIHCTLDVSLPMDRQTATCTGLIILRWHPIVIRVVRQALPSTRLPSVVRRLPSVCIPIASPALHMTRR